MSLMDDLAAALAPTVRGLTDQWGARVTVYRPTRTTNASGDPLRTYSAADPQLTNVPAFLAPGRSDGEHGAPVTVRPYGAVSDGRARLRLPALASGVLPVLDAFDGVKVLTGPYAGYTFLCDTDSAPDPAGLFTLVAVTSAPAGVIP